MAAEILPWRAAYPVGVRITVVKITRHKGAIGAHGICASSTEFRRSAGFRW